MNIAQSDDNTFAITDVTLQDLATLWHLFNRSSDVSLKDYYAKNFVTDTSSKYYGWKDIPLQIINYNNKITELLTVTPYMEMTNVDESLFELINEYLADLDDPLEYQDPLKSIPAQKKPKPKKKATKTKKTQHQTGHTWITGIHGESFQDIVKKGTGGDSHGMSNDPEIQTLLDAGLKQSSRLSKKNDPNDPDDMDYDIGSDDSNTKWTTPRTSSKRGKKNNNK